MTRGEQQPPLDPAVGMGLALCGGSCCSPINPLRLFMSICDSQAFFLLLNCQFPEKPSRAANPLLASDLETGDDWEK